MRDKLRNKLDGDIPDDVPHWIVEFHLEFDEPDQLPLNVARRGFVTIPTSGHCCVVTHVRSGLRWSVDLKTNEWLEIEEVPNGKADTRGI
jgi:hypothetical protein